MEKYCSNCGAELNENQDVCLGCGRALNNVVKKTKDHSTYITVTTIIMMILGVLLLFNSSMSISVFAIPGFLTIVGSTLALSYKKNENNLLVSGIIYLVAAFINTLAIVDISIFGILSIVFGILNIIYSKEKNKTVSN